MLISPFFFWENQAQGQSLPAECATVKQNAQSGKAGLFNAQDLAINLNSTNPKPATFAAKTINVKTEGGTLSKDVSLEGLAHSVSVVLLSAVTGQHSMGCSPEHFTATFEPVVSYLASGGKIHLTWGDVAIHYNGNQTTFATTTMVITGSSKKAPYTVSVKAEDIVKTPVDQTAALLPSNINLKFTIQPSSFPALMTLISGRPLSPSTQVALGNVGLEASKKQIYINGKGNVVLSASQEGSKASGEVSIQHFEDFIALLQQQHLTKASTIAILARFVAHHNKDNYAWDLNWEDGVLVVNHVPLPIQ
ncbi:hypothetical protein [Entomobacter blattae]|uniref:hypothetical protein n=1 Tax=Entomobacter blattae TaxID=2762277 RepID=UPI00193B0D03|nr:hypothetical protein [Entomobacter blattae]